MSQFEQIIIFEYLFVIISDITQSKFAIVSIIHQCNRCGLYAVCLLQLWKHRYIRECIYCSSGLPLIVVPLSHRSAAIYHFDN